MFFFKKIRNSVMFHSQHECNRDVRILEIFEEAYW